MSERTPYIFISHSSSDAEFTEYAAARLEEAGFRTWVDVESIPDGSSWPREIQKAVENCGAMLVIMSNAARESEWVERETLLAMSLRKPLFIALIEDTPLPVHLINRQFSDFRKRRDSAMRRLIGVLNKVSLTEPPQACCSPHQAGTPFTSPTSQRPSRVMPIGTISNRSGSIARMMVCAERSETSCSPERPPKTTPTRSFRAMLWLPDLLDLRPQLDAVLPPDVVDGATRLVGGDAVEGRADETRGQCGDGRGAHHGERF